MNIFPQPGHTDEALRLLAALFGRRFVNSTPSSSQPRNLAAWHACERLRDLFAQAETQASAQKLLETAVRQLHCSVREVHGILALARTIADLAASEQIQANHIAEAVQYRPRLDHP